MIFKRKYEFHHCAYQYLHEGSMRQNIIKYSVEVNLTYDKILKSQLIYVANTI